MRVRIGVAVVGACAGLAIGEPVTGLGGVDGWSNAGDAVFTITVDVSGMSFWDLQGSVFNESLEVFVGFGMMVSDIGWDVTLTTFGPSWASEATFGFNDVLTLAPGGGDSFPVSNMRYSSGGMVDLTDNGYDNVYADPDGHITIELFDTFDDGKGQIDATLGAGSVLRLGVPYPAPGTALTLGLGVLCCGRRRR